MKNVVFGGQMVGVAGVKECNNCRWADISDKPRTIRKGNVTIIQNGKHNISCTHDGNRTMHISDEGMKCSGWEPREE